MRRLLIFTWCLAATAAPAPLTLKEARERALRNHPALQSAQALERATLEVPKAIRSRLYPTVAGLATATAVNEDAARIFAGALNAPSLFNKAGTGIAITQQITDFGRTRTLSESAALRAQAQTEATGTTRAQILLQVSRAYFAVLRSQAVLRVAQQTVTARQLVADQTATLAQSKLKSELDVTFARVNLDEGRLLLSDAENEERSARAELARAMGDSSVNDYQLTEEPQPPAMPADAEPFLRDAMQKRPEVHQAQLELQAAERFAKAERALWFPTVNAAATAGYAPVRPSQFKGDWAAVAVNLEVPVFNGGLFRARRSEAEARAEASRQTARDVNLRITRDVNVAYLAALNAFQRLNLTAQLMQQADQSLKLAQARYDLGLGTIVELSQAQLNVTRAQIAQASAMFDYQAQRATLDFQSGNLP
jgi:outer membrane protein